jgi:hypothetical protein
MQDSNAYSQACSFISGKCQDLFLLRDIVGTAWETKAKESDESECWLGDDELVVMALADHQRFME